MRKRCDFTSSAVVVTDAHGRFALLKRARFPIGIAPASGHIDQHGSPGQAAVAELVEELGLVVELSALRPTRVQAQLVNNPCRRIGGDHHVWWVFEVTGVEAELRPSKDETRGASWYIQDELERLAQRTRDYQAGVVSPDEWEAEPGLEVVWLDLFVQLGYLRRTLDVSDAKPISLQINTCLVNNVSNVIGKAMARKQSTGGFSTIAVMVVVAALAVVGFAGWQVYRNSKNSPQAANNSNASTSNSNNYTAEPSYRAPEGWKWFEDGRLGMKFAYPDSWQVGEVFSSETAAGEQGWRVNMQPKNNLQGDPGLSLDTYPANSSIRDVDFAENYIKLQDVITAEKLTFSLVGFIEDPAVVDGPTQLYSTVCWPRNCTPKLANGRFVGIAVGAHNANCTRGQSCPTELNRNGENYKILLEILRSFTSL
jgi:8-oxo-dGTP pyrophosphatase MutT (NUDIX family)